MARAAVKTRKEIIADSARRIFQHIKPPADPHPKRTGISCIGRLRGDQLLLQYPSLTPPRYDELFIERRERIMARVKQGIVAPKKGEGKRQKVKAKEAAPKT